MEAESDEARAELDTFADRIAQQEAIATSLEAAARGLGDSAESARNTGLALAAEALRLVPIDSLPLKHTLRQLPDERLRAALLRSLEEHRTRTISELHRERHVRWEKPLTQDLGVGAGLDERTIELPLALELLESPAAGRALDAGASLNLPHVHAALADSRLRLIHVTQSGVREQALFDGPRVSYVFADLRKLPFRSRWFDRVVCVSTLEHVGMDNSRYGAEQEANPRSCVAAVSELARVLNAKGRLLVTVPFGRPVNHRWFRIFGRKDLRSIVGQLSGFDIELRFFVYDDCWRDAGEEEAAHVSTDSTLQAVGALAAIRATRTKRAAA